MENDYLPSHSTKQITHEPSGETPPVTSCPDERKTSCYHLVMRIKRLNDATVAAESPPSEHEQIFDLSQVIRSVGEELQTHKRKLVLMIFILFPLYSS